MSWFCHLQPKYDSENKFRWSYENERTVHSYLSFCFAVDIRLSMYRCGHPLMADWFRTWNPNTCYLSTTVGVDNRVNKAIDELRELYRLPCNEKKNKKTCCNGHLFSRVQRTRIGEIVTLAILFFYTGAQTRKPTSQNVWPVLTNSCRSVCCLVRGWAKTKCRHPTGISLHRSGRRVFNLRDSLVIHYSGLGFPFFSTVGHRFIVEGRGLL